MRLTRSGTGRAVPKYLAYAPAAAWAAGLLYLGSRTFAPIPLPDIDLPFDKIAHFVLYGGLGLLAVAGWHWAGRRPAVWLPIGCALLVGAIDELQQRRIAARSSDVYDWLADAVAIILAFLVFGRRRTPITEVE
jgi:VanZ family protein